VGLAVDLGKIAFSLIKCEQNCFGKSDSREKKIDRFEDTEFVSITKKETFRIYLLEGKRKILEILLIL